VSTHPHRRDPLHRYGPDRQQQRRRLSMLLVISLILPLGGAGIWLDWVWLFG
jgi:hypothetical protein